MTEKLKSCPFCGGEARLKLENGNTNLGWLPYNEESISQPSPQITDDALTSAVAIGEYALTAKYTGMLTEDTIITRDVLKTLITHAIKGENK